MDERAARVAALDALARRDHGSSELWRKLTDKGCDPALAAAVVERLLAEHLLDDGRYVGNFVAYHAGRGHGPVRIRVDLRKIGLHGEIVDHALAAYPDWMLQLQAARKKKYGAALPSDFADMQRQARFLGYRGFTGAQIRTALGFDTDLRLDDEET